MPIIKQDGKTYDFKPGKNGSLTDMTKKAPAPPITPHPHISKVVPCINCNEPMSSEAGSCSACGSYQKPQTSAVRG